MPWNLYDALIADLPDHILIEEVISGPKWTMVRAGTHTGCAMTIPIDTISPVHTGDFIGMSLKEAGSCAKSWNFLEASIGMAAINAYYNNTQQEDHLLHTVPQMVLNSAEDAFHAHIEEMRGKKVAVIGHFPKLDFLREIVELSILERNPQTGDYPDSACEYLLPEQDFVFITGSTLVNKTLPRLLALSKQAYTILVGPSSPLSPVLLDYGVDELNTTMILDSSACREIVKSGGNGGALAKVGRRAGLRRE
jgi:uncharacterized protein (DUF4213/DUF364 family)